MKVTLTVPERIALGSSILPSENNFVTLKVVRNIKKQIGFSEEELKNLSLKTINLDGGMTRFEWDRAKELPVEYEFSDKAVEIILESLESLGKNKKANEQHLAIWEKFTGVPDA
jgi:hypothetical protein